MSVFVLQGFAQTRLPNPPWRIHRRTRSCSYLHRRGGKVDEPVRLALLSREPLRCAALFVADSCRVKKKKKKRKDPPVFRSIHTAVSMMSRGETENEQAGAVSLSLSYATMYTSQSVAKCCIRRRGFPLALFVRRTRGSGKSPPPPAPLVHCWLHRSFVTILVLPYRCSLRPGKEGAQARGDDVHALHLVDPATPPFFCSFRLLGSAWLFVT